MSDEMVGKGIGIGADVILEFDRSIKNIQDFGSQLELLDARFGKLDSRIDSMRSSLSNLSAQTTKATGSNLRKQIESEVNNLLQSNGIALSSIGSAPLKVKQDTVRHLFARVDAELNRAILKQIGNIHVKIDPSYNTGVIPISKGEFDELNKEIARLVRTQVKNLTDSLRKQGGDIVNPDSLAGLQMDISKSTVKQILLSIRDQIKPLILNPEVNTGGQKLTFSQKDFTQLMNKIKAQVKNAIDFDFQGTLNKGNQGVDAEIKKTAMKIDNVVENYVKAMRGGIASINPHTVEMPMKNLSKRLQQYIANDMGVSTNDLNRTLGTIDVGSANGYELKRQFASLERTINSKMSSGTSKMITQLRDSVRQVDLEPSTSLKHHLISEINKLNNEIVKKIRESVDKQFAHIKGEVSSVVSSPKNINQSGKLKGMAGGGGNTYNNTTINNHTNNNNAGNRNSNMSSQNTGNLMDSGMNMERAISNTMRHIMAGSLVGAPMMAMYQAVETFKTVQLEQLKITQNMALKDEYRDENGATNWGAVNTGVQGYMENARGLSNLYGLDYGDMSKVAAVATRLTSDTKEAQKFTDSAAQIYRLDNESDLTGTIAPGLEAVMAQFKLSVWELDKVVNAFAVATTMTKATSDEVMNAMSRSGSALNSAKVSVEDAVALNALAIQTSGQSGENIGNAFKTIASRVTLPSVTSKLEEQGIDVFETNDMGLKVRRSLIDILEDTAKVTESKYTGEDTVQDILLGEGGGYQYPKLLSFLDKMHSVGKNDTETSGLTFWKIQSEIKEWEQNPDRVMEMLSTTMNSPSVTMDKAGVSVNNALYSILDEMNPTLQQLAKNITNLAHGIENNSDVAAKVVGAIGNALIGFAALYGMKRIGQAGEYDKHYGNAQDEKRYMGGTSAITGRQVYGATNFLNGHVLGSNQDLRDKVNDKGFYRAAMKNDTLRPYYQELANMDNDRRREIRQYTKDKTGKVGSMADLFSVMDESRGYRRGKPLSVDELHQRSSYNTKELVNNKNLTNTINRDFAQQFTNLVSDRNSFDGLDDKSKSTSERLGRMSDYDRRDFENYLHRNYASVGKAIDDVDGLSKALDEHEKANRKAESSARTGSDSYRDLSRAVRNVSDEADRASSGRMNRFLDMIDSIPQRARGAGGAIMGVAKNIGNFAKQLAAALAVGDLISEGTSYSMLTGKQKDIANFTAQSKGAAEKYASFTEEGLLGKAGIGLGAIWGTMKNFVLPGQSATDVGDLAGFESGFLDWLDKEYGTRDMSKALKSENKSRKEEDPYAEEYTAEDLTNKYLDVNGDNSKLQKMEKENFIDEYQKNAISDAEQKMRLDDAEKARKAWEDKMVESGQYDYFSSDELKNRITESQSQINMEGQLSLLKAVLGGVKSDSEEYMKIRLEAIQKERDAYSVEMADLRDFINEREKELAFLEESGKAYTTDPETGEKVETTEYGDIKESVERNKEKEKTLQKEFDLADKQAELESQQIETDFYINKATKGFSRAQSEKSYQDTLNALYMNTESPQYIDSQINSSKDALSIMRSELSSLQAQNLADPDNQLEDAMLDLKSQIASTELEVKNLRLQRLTAWRNDYDVDMEENEIKYLQERVNLGMGGSTDNILSQDVRLRELNDQKNIIDRALSQRVAERDSGKYQEGSSEYEQIMKDIRDLTKQSLNAQLGIQTELKNSLGGTFNLPDGVKVMSQYDYMAGKGTHSNMTVQSGDMYVNITLPNVTGKTSTAQLQTIGTSLGSSLASGRASSMRNQMNAAPWGYSSF